MMTTPPSGAVRWTTSERDVKTKVAKGLRELLQFLTLVTIIVAVVFVTWVLYNRPPHLYPTGANAVTWRADVGIALSESGSGVQVVPKGPLSDLPGVGKIVKVMVERSPSGKRVVVFFLTHVGIGSNYTGLVYLDGYSPPADTCNVHLNGPWWQLSPLNYNTNDCSRGFHFTGGG